MNSTARKGKTVEGGYYAVLIGDIAKSRSFPDQKALFDQLRSHFAWVNRHVEAIQALELGFERGDEFQAAYSSIESAIRASILLRIRFKLGELKPLAREQDVRVGLGYGQISVYDETTAPRGQSGDAWWNARAAIDDAEQRRRRHEVPSGSLTRFQASDPGKTGIINALLTATDQVLYRMDRRDFQITMASIAGSKQKDIARQLGITQSAVSRRSRSQGAFAIKAILNELAEHDAA
jgi:hypothetical protein